MQPGQIPGALQGIGNNAAPPGWVKEGMRLSYKIAVATTVNQPGAPGAGGGAGIYTVDIVAMARGQVAIDTRFYVGGPDTQQAATMTSMNGQVVSAAACDFWIHPQQLANMLRAAPGGMKVNQAPLDLNGRQVQAIRVQAGDANAPGGGSQTVNYYEPQSGVLLQQQTRAAGVQGAQNSVMTMVDMRERKFPWAMGRPPSWLAKFRKYTYSGNMQFILPGSDIQVPPTPITISYDIINNGPNYIVARQTIQNQGQVAQATQVFGPTQFSSVYIPPLALRQLQQGQVVDEDKVLGTRTVVSGIGQAPYGRNVATIIEDGPGYTQICDYELETGIMLGTVVHNKVLNQVAQVALTEIR